MRSRTELVTTTFVDSDEEDYSEDDDSEEDWRPNKKRQQKQVGGDGGRKRRAAALAATKAKRRAGKVSGEDFDTADEYELDTENSDEEEEEYEDATEGEDYAAASTSAAPKRNQSLPPKKQIAKLAQLDLLLNKQELLATDWVHNNRLCLWRKDDQTHLLQKYLRVKAAAMPVAHGVQDEEQLIFTSSSVYSSWDEQHISDFINVKVDCLDPNNRRVKLNDLRSLKRSAQELQMSRTAENIDENDNEDESTDQELHNESLKEQAAEQQPQDEDSDLDDDDDDDDEDEADA